MNKNQNATRITIKNLQKEIFINPQKIRKVIFKVLRQEAKNKDAQISLSFVKDKLIRRMNLKYLNKDCATDVLAFDLSNKKTQKTIAADIIVSIDTALSNSRVFKTTALYEIYLYVVHGLLHILGYEHKTKTGRRMMDHKTSIMLKKLDF